MLLRERRPCGVFVDHGQVEVSARHVQREGLSPDVFGQSRLEGRTGALSQLIEGHERQVPGRGGSHGADRIGEERGQSLDALGHAQAVHGIGRGGADLGIGVSGCPDPLGGSDHGLASQLLQGTRAHDGRHGPVGNEPGQRLISRRLTRARRREGLAVVRSLLAHGSVPLDHGVGGPLRFLADVAGRARVGHADLHREVGARDPYAVVGTELNSHVGPGRHVAGDARGAFGAFLVEVMLGRIEIPGRTGKTRIRIRLVALDADLVARQPEFAGVGVVAVRTGDAALEHETLTERAVHVHLFELLAVGVVEPVDQEARQVVVEHRLAGRGPGREFTAPHMAGRAEFRPPSRIRAADVHGQGVRLPGRGRGPLARAPQTRLPFDVPASRPMAGLAGDVVLRPSRREGVGLRVVTFLIVGGVTDEAHGVRGLVPAGPVQDIARGRLLVRIEVEPLPVRAVPRDSEGLQPSPRHFDQVLLQGLEAEGVLDLEVRGLSVSPFDVHEEFVAALEETRGDAPVGEGRVLEIPPDRLFRGQGHGFRVMRVPPLPRLFLMAAEAGSVLYVRRGNGGRAGRGRRSLSPL